MNPNIDIPEIPNLIHYAIPFFILTLIIEIVLTSRRQMKSYTFNDAAASISMGLGNVFIGLFAKALVFSALTYVYLNFRIFTIPFVWWAWILVLLADDFCYYWFHRISHENRFFWASHVVHHSSQRYNLSTALRQTWTGSFMSFVFWLPMALLGFHPIMILAQMSVSLLYQYWIHTELIDKMPQWFEAVFNTPSHHRVHHGRNPQYLDANYAGTLIIWDKMFGTFEAETDDEKIRYGIIKQLGSFNLLWAVFHEWIGMLTDIWRAPWKHKLSYLLRDPGWTHDGSRDTSDTIRARWLARQTKQNPVASENAIAADGKPA